MTEPKGPYQLAEQKPDEDAPADGGLPFWDRAFVSKYNYMRIQALGLDLVSVVLATQKDTHIRAAAAELRRLLKGE